MADPGIASGGTSQRGARGLKGRKFGTAEPHNKVREITGEKHLSKAEAGQGIIMARRRLETTYVLIFLVILVNSCAVKESTQTEVVYYTIPAVTYLRESPGYASPIIAPVYQADQVKIVSSTQDDWCRVQSVQNRQIGWIQRPLLSAVPLREAPQEEVISRHVLHQGDKVRKLSENQQGWWRVLVEKDKSLGWIPAVAVSGQLSEKVPPGQVVLPTEGSDASTPPSFQPSPKHYYYVAATTLDLHLLPLVSSQVVKVLKFNDKVEKIAQSGSQWLKVRYPETGARGWALVSHLAESPSKAPKTFIHKKKKPRKRPMPLKPQEDDSSQPETLDPEIM